MRLARLEKLGSAADVSCGKWWVGERDAWCLLLWFCCFCLCRRIERVVVCFCIFFFHERDFTGGKSHVTMVPKVKTTRVSNIIVVKQLAEELLTLVGHAREPS